MGTYGNLWEHRRPMGTLWELGGSHERLWELMGTCGNLWELVKYLTFGDPERSRSLIEVLDAEDLANGTR